MRSKELGLTYVSPFLLAVLALGQLSVTSASQTTFDVKSSASLLSGDFNAYAEKIRAEWGVPGCSVSVVKVVNDSLYSPPIVETKGFGIAGEGRAVTDETTFAIASNSKLFTAAAIGSLVDAGKLNWTSRIKDILPEFGMLDDYDGGELTIRDALSHRSGLPRHDLSLQNDEPLEVVVSRLKYLKPSAEFREVFQYNNLMFVTAARIVEHVTGTTFQDYVSSHFFDHPALNMSHTTYTPTESFSTGYGVYPSNNSAFIYPFELAPTGAGAGGVISNAVDVARWMSFLIKSRRSASSGVAESDPTPLSRKALLAITTAYTISEGSPLFPELSTITYGHGVGLVSYAGHNLWTHGGSLPGFGSEITWVPDAGVGVGVMCNSAGEGNMVAFILTFRLLEDLFGIEHQVDWNGRFRALHNRSLALQTHTPSKVESISRLCSCYRGAFGHTCGIFEDDHEHEDPLSHISPRSYFGIFEDPGYGESIVCPLPEVASRYELPDACHNLYKSIKGGTYLPKAPPPTTSHSFLIAMPRTFVGYLHLSHKDGPNFTGIPYAIVPPVGNRTWPILEVVGRLVEVEFKFQGDREPKSVVGMDWRGIWGAGGGVVENEGRVEVAFRRAS
ncbi:hypothetical protein JAAARDRAFT_61799 [Jaapia argillacea MUCL 33604]|uniref:Beta-lactamase-related domain-containing protein n=1 Tax=Jaapia argillacea MUCL 33604 TaxID=933084 RepID=A0A067PC64_9AGAM|nr:hypothetical protein JAAARDRAFT_61799 [Jaapia argillacea MUCL 33604]